MIVTGIVRLTCGICFILGLFAGWAWWVELLLAIFALSFILVINGETA